VRKLKFCVSPLVKWYPDVNGDAHLLHFYSRSNVPVYKMCLKWGEVWKRVSQW